MLVHEAVARVAAAAALLWLGMILGISFIETPLKFRAPGIEMRAALSIGRTVFRGLNLAELGWLVVIVICLVGQPQSVPISMAAVVAGALLLVQLEVVRPQLNRRTDEFLAGVGGIEETRTQAHRRYVVLECLKVVALIVLAVLLLAV